MATLNEKGHEILDPEPVAMPVGFRVPESLTDQIRRFVKAELSLAASAQGHESFEEADDFDIEDDFHGNDPQSEWELNFDHETAGPANAGSAGGGNSNPPAEPASKWDGNERRGVGKRSDSAPREGNPQIASGPNAGNDANGNPAKS